MFELEAPKSTPSAVASHDEDATRSSEIQDTPARRMTPELELLELPGSARPPSLQPPEPSLPWSWAIIARIQELSRGTSLCRSRLVCCWTSDALKAPALLLVGSAVRRAGTNSSAITVGWLGNLWRMCGVSNVRSAALCKGWAPAAQARNVDFQVVQVEFANW